MSVEINYKNNLPKNINGNLIFFVDEKYSTSGIQKYFTKSENLLVSNLIKTQNLSKKIVNFDLSLKKKIFLISVKKKINLSQIENLGAEFFNYLKDFRQKEFLFYSDVLPVKQNNFIGHFLHGFKLKSYSFEKYKSKKNKKSILIKVFGNNTPSLKDKIKFRALEEGTFFTRDLVSEPGNVLHPDEYAKRLKSLSKIGLKINVYDEIKLKKLGMNTLLGVGQGSIRGSYLVTIEWNGAIFNSLDTFVLF